MPVQSSLSRPLFQATLMGVLAFLSLLAFHDTALWEWDTFNFLHDIYAGRRVSILLGRPGYVAFFHSLWWLAQKLGMSDFHSQFVPVIVIMNCALTGVFAGTLYWLIRAMSGPAVFAAIAAALFTANRAVLETAFSVHADMLMLTAVILSYAFFLHAHRSRKTGWLYFSALLFGYAFCVREAAILFAAFFPVSVLGLGKAGRFSLKSYVLASIIPLVLGAAPVIYFLVADRASFLADFHMSNDRSNSVPITQFASNLAQVLRRHFLVPPWLGFVLGAGALIFHLRPRWLGFGRRQAAAFAFFGILPCLIVIFVTNSEVPKWGRYFVPGAAVWAVYLSVPVFLLVDFIRKKFKHPAGKVVAALLFVAGTGALIGFHEADFKKVRGEGLIRSNGMEGIYTKIQPLMGPNVAWLLGHHSAYVHYRLKTSGREAFVIFSGWVWPGEGLAREIEAHLDAGRTVVFDPPGPWYENERRDLEKTLPLFENLPQHNGMVILRRKIAP